MANAGTRLPERYHEDWRKPFLNRALAAAADGAQVLDVGSGRLPVIPTFARPRGCTYVGLDISSDELQKAPPRSYDATIVADVTCHRPELDSSFDVIVSWQTLEHIQRLDRAVANIRRYLRAHGTAVIQVSGSFSAFAMINRALPDSLAARLVCFAMDRPYDGVFPAYYDRCSYRSLQHEFECWSSVEILPRYRGAEYFQCSRPLQSIYVLYENWAVRHEAKNLATHYLVTAVK